MEKISAALEKCFLFQQMTPPEIIAILQQSAYHTAMYAKGHPVAIEGDPCPHIGIVISGSAELQQVYASGKAVTIDTLIPGHSFGEVVLFSNTNRYPVTVIAKEPTEVLFWSKPAILELCGYHTVFLNNLLGQLSNRILWLNHRIKLLSYQTVRQKVAGLLLDEYKRQGRKQLTFAYTRKEMADLLGIPRPSLSRELALLKTEQFIDYGKNTILIRNLELLENCLF
jgi:CRP-like cAMP-binding protein